MRRPTSRTSRSGSNRRREAMLDGPGFAVDEKRNDPFHFARELATSIVGRRQGGAALDPRRTNAFMLRLSRSTSLGTVAEAGFDLPLSSGSDSRLSNRFGSGPVLGMGYPSRFEASCVRKALLGRRRGLG